MIAEKVDEKILVVKRDTLFAAGDFQGFVPARNFENYQQIVVRHQEFLWRSTMETDPSYKQIIPYLVFRHNQNFFVMQRKSTATESRLKNKYSLGIGGHIRCEDMQGKTLSDWARREFEEEVSYAGNLSIQPLGLINDDSNAVGQVHVGFVFLLGGDSANIAVKSELKEGVLMTLAQMQPRYENMERWSQLVYDFLENCGR
jgi:predicted NUDIX family phosphoesterase